MLHTHFIRNDDCLISVENVSEDLLVSLVNAIFDKRRDFIVDVLLELQGEFNGQ